MPEGDPAGLEGHLRDAIRLNRARRARYVRLGGWRASLVSRLLVGAELGLLPVARVLDRWSRRYGSPILASDVADMEAAPRSDRPVPAPISGGASRQRGVPAHGPTALSALGGRLAQSSRWLERRAASRGRHVALSTHVLDSAAVMAVRGHGYAEASEGRTRWLSWTLALGHLGLLPAAILLDWLAAPLHRRGVGILVNDLPPVPSS